jgi:predicted nucleotidyltransferase
MVSIRQIREWSRSVAAQFKPERIILFGSYAYGRPREDSDVDLLVVLSHEGLAARKASEIRLALPSNVPVDVIVRSPEKLRERLQMNDFFMRDIMEKGLVLYASGNKRMA